MVNSPSGAALRIYVIFTVFSILLSLSLYANLIYHRKSRTEQKKRVPNRVIKEMSNETAYIPEEYLRSFPNISRHDYKYLINPQDGELCRYGPSDARMKFTDNTKRNRRLLILFMVHSKAEHFRFRKTIRETWGSVGKRLTQIVFLLGNPGNLTTQRQVDEEHKLHGDIVQEEFDETYRNITVKNIMGLKWASKYCSHAAYVVKCDDDMFVNTKLLISTVINSKLPRKRLILCKIHFFKNVPREGKYAINKSLYSADFWPSFCFGGCWIASADVVRNLYEISLNSKQIYLDDVYVTGILRTKLALPLNYLSRSYRIFCHTRGNYALVREMWDTNKAKNSLQKKVEPYIDFWTTCFK